VTANNTRVRVVAHGSGRFYQKNMTAGDIYPVAGNGSIEYSGDGGPALKAGLTVASMTLDHHGNLVIGNGHNDRVRVVAESTGMFYGQPMTAGDIYTVAGNGQRGYSGDGGPATGAGLYSPYSVLPETGGGLAISDSANNRIREVTG
jgi:hypothetical protein